MTYILIIDKYGKINEKNLKQYQESELYKKAGFKKPNEFAKQHTWENVELDTNKTFAKIHMYAKTKGNSGMENKYEFPPPVDNLLCFGAVVLVYENVEGTISDLRKSDWTDIYNTLYGGFEDTRSKSDDEEEEEEMLDKSKLTKEGYLKDNFIVDDPEESEGNDDFEYESELSEDDYFE